MPLANYGVLKGKVSNYILASSGNEHFQVEVDAGGVFFRIAINVKSSVSPPEVLFFMDEQFEHPVLQQLEGENLAAGFTALASTPASLALDFIRKNLFPINQMKPIPFNKPGADNDLNEKLEFYVKQAHSDADAVVYAFGQRWGPEPQDDKYFHFQPGNGIHDIHMNQGNSGRFKKDNGVYQDGGLFIHLPSRGRWVAVFIAFQVQAWHTDDQTGNPLADVPNDGGGGQPGNTASVRIVAAMVNPRKGDVGKEYIILMNKSSDPVNLQGWKIVDKTKVNADLLGNVTMDGGSTLRVNLTGRGAQLGNKGGVITLLNKKGLKVDGVAYSKKDAAKEGELIEL
ncbi:DUF2278 family protein [Chryseolinea lacunae]|uniref:DUF2278 family protein n=1 Tax=Chryseolinea lacunae TaxID=2801331 RepID=A0ABS1L0M9_9BACT|nr:DUF2278 family protein [Chryseolinea lacunae]MBL0744126.1 DUF2278 family protein [Chryseolinea lacunae]